MIPFKHMFDEKNATEGRIHDIDSDAPFIDKFADQLAKDLTDEFFLDIDEKPIDGTSIYERSIKKIDAWPAFSV